MTTIPEKDNKRIIEKIKSTLNLANAKDDHESHTAMLLAQSMMAKYGIVMDDVIAQDGEAVHKSKEIMEMYATKPQKLQWWQKQLSLVVADNFRCYTFYRSIRGMSRIVFVGLKEDTQIAREVLLYAQDSINYLSVAYLNKRGVEGLTERTKVRNDYITGFIVGLKEKFLEQVENNEWGLILVKDDDVVEYFEKIETVKGASSSAMTGGDSEAIMAGHSDGKRMDHKTRSLKG